MDAPKHFVCFRRNWSDEDVINMAVGTSGRGGFMETEVFTTLQHLTEVTVALRSFALQVHGGICDVRFGEFGREFAGGAVHLRLHFYPPSRGRVCVTLESESAWYRFKDQEVADLGLLHVETEPASLDRFVEQLSALAEGGSDEANLECRQ